MKRKNFTPKQTITKGIVSLFLLFFMAVYQPLSAQVYCPLACNDDVQVSVDNNCEALITPEMVLEGENPACNYFIKKIYWPNGTVIPPTGGIPGYYVLGRQYLGYKLNVEVGYGHPTNPNLPHPTNLNVCWGSIILEDKLAPVLNCLQDVYVGCYEDLSNYLTTNTNRLYPYTTGDTIRARNNGTVYEHNTLFGGLPIPTNGGWLDIPINVDNAANQSEFLNQLKAEISVNSTQNIRVEIYPPNPPPGYVPNTLQTPFVDTYFEGLQMVDSYFAGTWRIRVINVGTQTRTLTAAGLRLQSESYLTSPYGLEDNCEVDEIWVVSDKTVDLDDCGEYSAIRTIVFRGKDHAGMLSNTCTHTIYYERKTVNDIEWPLNRDDYQLDALNCDNIPSWDLNGDGYPQPNESGLPTIGGYPLFPDLGKTGYCEILVTYTDQIVQVCPGTFKVLRLWTAVNCCGPTGEGNPRTHYQIIKVVDDKGPIVSACFPDVVVNANPFTCQQDVKLPHPGGDPHCPMVIYDCQLEDVTYTVGYKFGGCDNPPGEDVPWIYNTGLVLNADGSYTLKNAPFGCTWIKYTFTDPCGNSTEAFFEVLVEDKVPPVPVCDQNTVVTVAAECSARIYAETFDDGSWDNCSPVTFEVRRMTGTCGNTHLFGPYVDICPSDVGKTFMVELKVIDEAGNWNSCMVNVFVDDKTPPVFTYCPPPITIDCNLDYKNLSITGQPEVADNCGIASLTYVDSGSLNECNVGTITRRWTVVDNGGRTATCSQTITVVNTKPFTRNDITWPSDKLNIQGCLNSSTHPDATGYPILNDNFCSLVAFTYEDQVFTLVEGACYKILRTWTVLDWCQFNQSNPNSPGVWKHTQIIKVYNNVAPTFTSSCSNVTIDGYNADCTGNVDITATATDDCTPVDQLNWQYKVDLFRDGTIDYFGFTNRFQRNNLPLGVHHILWEVEDACGNVKTCSYNFTLKDSKKPTPVCISDVTTVIMPSSGTITVDARVFDHGSFDNCTKGATCDDCNSDLKYSFSPNVNDKTRTFTLANVGLNVLQMWVTDEFGNQDYCEVTLRIQHNTAGILPMVSGNVATEEGSHVSGAEVKLSEMNSNESSYSTTNGQGYFELLSNQENGDYSVSARKQDSYTSGLSTLDLVILQKHLLGITAINSPYKLLAADADKNGSISANDIFQLRRLILGVDNKLSKHENAWSMVNADYEFTSSANPWLNLNLVQLHNRVYMGLATDQLSTNFVAIKIGDINGSINQLLEGGQVENRNMMSLYTVNREFTEGQIIEVPVYSADFNEIAGMQFSAKFNESVFSYEGFGSGAIKIASDQVALIGSDLMNLSWNLAEGVNVPENEVLFTIRLRAKTNGQLENNLAFATDMISAEAYTQNLETKKLVFDIRSNMTEGFVLHQNTPNPFDNETEIVFELPQAELATLKVFDVTGRVLMTVSQEFAKGRNSVSMSKKDLGNSGGVLYYQLETKDKTAVRKMILLN